MSFERVPDYDLPDEVVASTHSQLKALADPLRSSLLDLVLDRAATVADLAVAVKRPKSSVAHHVNVLVDAGLLCVVRTRQIKAIEERFYGRTGRTIRILPADTTVPAVESNLLEDAAIEARRAAVRDDLRSTLRHVRVSPERAQVFWDRLEMLAEEFTREPRAGDVVYGLVAAIYPTDQPTLAPPMKENIDE